MNLEAVNTYEGEPLSLTLKPPDRIDFSPPPPCRHPRHPRADPRQGHHRHSRIRAKADVNGTHVNTIAQRSHYYVDTGLRFLKIRQACLAE